MPCARHLCGFGCGIEGERCCRESREALKLSEKVRLAAELCGLELFLVIRQQGQSHLQPPFPNQLVRSISEFADTLEHLH